MSTLLVIPGDRLPQQITCPLKFYLSGREPGEAVAGGVAWVRDFPPQPKVAVSATFTHSTRGHPRHPSLDSNRPSSSCPPAVPSQIFLDPPLPVP
jgi:hypothetical protein